MFPPPTTAGSFVPSADEVIDIHSFFLMIPNVFSVQVSPESVDVQMFPITTTAASFVPSADEVIEDKSLGVIRNLWLLNFDQVVPELVDVQMYPIITTAAIFVPSADEVIDCQFLGASK